MGKYQALPEEMLSKQEVLFIQFPTLVYTSTCEIPTLLYTWSLKKVPLSGRASPYRPLEGVPPPPPDQTLSRVFDISSQSKQKLRSKRRSKLVEVYANLDPVSKPPSRLWLSLF